MRSGPSVRAGLAAAVVTIGLAVPGELHAARRPAPISAIASFQHTHHGPDKPAPEPPPSQPSGGVDDDRARTGQGTRPLPPFIPPITDEDRKAAFPDVDGHTVHDQAVNHFVLVDGLEWQAGAGGGALDVATKGWIGRDIDRLWFRAEGDAEDGDLAGAEAQVFYGRQISRWWDIVGGLRQDFRPGPARTWVAIGVQGLAPYWFDVEATAYIGESGRTHVRGEVEYELLLTNRLILQPLVEIDIYGKSDPERRIGAGISSTDAGVRLRYEFRREFAPYIGVTWNNKHGRTADLAESHGERTGGARFVTGVRLWF